MDKKHKYLLSGAAALVLVILVVVLLVVFIPHGNGDDRGTTTTTTTTTTTPSTTTTTTTTPSTTTTTTTPPIPPQPNPAPVNACKKRMAADSFVCVCSADYCDGIEPLGQIDDGEMVFYLSSKEALRFSRKSIQQGNTAEKENDAVPIEIRIDDSKKYQPFYGIGSTFTDAAGINARSLNDAARDKLIKAYWDKDEGIRYTFGRVPVSSTDFSTRIYSYNDQPYAFSSDIEDFEMQGFKLAYEDFYYKIPDIQRAMEVAGPNNLKLFATSWSPPWWMKESERMPHASLMKGNLSEGFDQYYRAYALYYRKFYEAYAEHNIKFWGMTLANEPEDNSPWQASYLYPEMAMTFVHTILKPELQKLDVTKDLKYMAHDEARDRVARDAAIFYADPEKAKSINGLAIHWYSESPYAVLQEVHSLQPEGHFIINSEACNGFGDPGVRGPQLGNWTRGWMYGHDVLNDMANWASGWADWNYCLNMEGHPTWYNNIVDAPILVDKEKQEFYKQPMFYFLGHFSRFIPVGAVRIDSKMFDENGNEVKNRDEFNLKGVGILEQIVFHDSQSGQKTIVLINGDENKPRLVTVKDGQKSWQIAMPKDSIVSAIWNA